MIDVFLGRGAKCYNKPGTKKYRDMIKLYAQYFCPNATKSQKSTFIEKLWFQMHLQGFRFFVSSVSEDDQNIWKEASNLEVKKRIGHALRDHRKCHFKDRAITNGESNPQATSLQLSPHHKNQAEAHSILDFDQNKITALESGPVFEDQQDNYHDEVPSSANVDVSGWKNSSEKSNRCDEIMIFISHVQDCYVKSKASSKSESNVRCNLLTSANVKEPDSALSSSDIGLLNASDENSKGNESHFMYLFIGYTTIDQYYICFLFL
jgi:hypothetical protein